MRYLFIDERWGIGACLADPFANGEGRENLIRSPSQKGAGGGCIDPMGI